MGFSRIVLIAYVTFGSENSISEKALGKTAPFYAKTQNLKISLFVNVNVMA